MAKGILIQRITCWITRHVIPSLFFFLAGLILMLSSIATRWHPPLVEASRTVRDERGVTVGLPLSIKTQAVFMAIGVGEYLLVTRRPGGIITSRVETNQLIKHSSLLERAFPRLHQMQTPLSVIEPGAMNFETLLFDKPDVMVTWARMAADFERLGLRVVGLGSVTSTERIAQNTSLFSAIFSEPQRAASLIQNALAERQKIAQEVALKAKARSRLLYLIKVGHGQWRVGHGFPDIIAEAGGFDIGQNLDHGSLNAEELLALAPDVIVLMGGTWLETKAPEELMQTPSLAPIPAVKNHRVYNTPPGVSGYMATMLELPIYLQWLAEILHPEELGHNVRDLARQVYTTDLGIAPTEGELDVALAIAANQHSAFQHAYGDQAR